MTNIFYWSVNSNIKSNNKVFELQIANLECCTLVRAKMTHAKVAFSGPDEM